MSGKQRAVAAAIATADDDDSSDDESTMVDARHVAGRNLGINRQARPDAQHQLNLAASQAAVQR